MKGTAPLRYLFSPLFLAFFAASLAATACSKSNEKPAKTAAVQEDTMLMHDLAEANRNTAAPLTDTSEAVIRARGGGAGPSVLTNGSGTRKVDDQIPASSSADNPGTAPTRPSNETGLIRAPNNNSSGTGSSDSNSPSTPRTASSGDACDSPSAADQRTCLNRLIVVNDAELNRTYRDVIAQSKLSGGPELEERFRQAQRAWVDRRDVECRQQTSQAGPLWAKPVARCLAEYSSRRTVELQRSLSGLKGQ
jgi:uncharacterized protein YecT (DUF1311 family)